MSDLHSISHSTHDEKHCLQCQISKTFARIQERYPTKTIGMQYAYMDLGDSIGFIVSAEEVEYLNSAEELQPTFSSDLPSPNGYLTLAYGVFRSQTDWHEDCYDLLLAKGATYFYLDQKHHSLEPVIIEDYEVLDRQGAKVKVAVLVRSSHKLAFPRSQAEAGLTLTRYMPALGQNLGAALFSRIEYGFFRLDKGKRVFLNADEDWRKRIRKLEKNQLDYDRFLIMDHE